MVSNGSSCYFFTPNIWSIISFGQQKRDIKVWIDYNLFTKSDVLNISQLYLRNSRGTGGDATNQKIIIFTLIDCKRSTWTIPNFYKKNFYFSIKSSWSSSDKILLMQQLNLWHLHLQGAVPQNSVTVIARQLLCLVACLNIKFSSMWKILLYIIVN